MQIKRDSATGLWCRSDGAVLMPPTKHSRFKSFRWAFGTMTSDGYRVIKFHGKIHRVHQIICRAFNGPAPVDRPLVDHINRIRHDNRPNNLHWVSCKENNDNAGRVDQSIEKYGVRECDNKAAYNKAYYVAHHEECKARSRAYYAAHC